MSTLSPIAFNGSSQFAADLKQAITHAVTIASLPLNELNDSVNTLTRQGNELATLQDEFSAVRNAIQNLATAAKGGGLTASSGTPAVATATFNPSAAISAGVYSVNVVDAGSPTTALSLNGLTAVADPSTASVTSSSSFTLTVNGTSFTVVPSGNTLTALAQAINLSGAGVNATLVNIGYPPAADYRLSLQSVALGNVAIQLNDGSQDLLSNVSTGTAAQYQIDGQPVPPAPPISSSSDTITLAPGLNANLLAAGQTTITVAPDPSAASSALASFASAYNSVIRELRNNHGTAGGALSGQNTVLALEHSLRDLSGFSGGNGAVQNLTSLGLTFDQTGRLTFDASQFASVSAQNPADVAAFLGSTSGGGFLTNATDILSSIADPISGIIQTTENTLQQQINSDNQLIASTQDRVAAVQNQITAQMAAADAAISALESQASYLTTLFADTQNALYGQNHG